MTLRCESGATLDMQATELWRVAKTNAQKEDVLEAPVSVLKKSKAEAERTDKGIRNEPFHFLGTNANMVPAQAEEYMGTLQQLRE